MKKKVITFDRILLIMIIILILGVSLWGIGDKVQAGYAVADCVDADEDGYYNEGCTLEDFGCEEKIELIVDSNSQTSPSIDENYFVYVSDSKVYGYDLITKRNLMLSNAEEESLNPRIDAPYIVWQAFIGNYWQVYVYDQNTLTSRIISSSVSHQINPDIYSNYVVWADNRGGDWDIYLYDLDLMTESLIISGTGNQYLPKIYGNYVAYVDDSSGTKDVYLYSLSLGTKILIDGSLGSQNGISIDNNYVVWQSNAAGNWDVYLYDIAKSQIKAIATESVDERLPRISEDLIVWMKYDGNDYDLEYYDFGTKENYLLTDDGFNQIVPVVSSAYVIWLDDQNGNYDIFGQTVNPICDDVFFGDCDDINNLVSPAGIEVCDLVDNDCDNEIDEGCNTATTGEAGECLISEITSNVWVESTWNRTINSAIDGESVFLVSYGDGSCGTEASDFYLYSVVYDSGEYVTDELVESFTSATMKNYETYDASYMNWDVVYDSGKYYYFISVLNSTAVLGDTLLVCATGEVCSEESVTISDALDYLELYSGSVDCITDDDCDSGETCVENACEIAETVETCTETWDCSNVEWSECLNGISTLDITLCQSIPLSDACFTNEYYPITEKSCYSTNNAAEVVDSIDEEEMVEEMNEEVPVFTWINLLLVIGILCGYYVFRR